MRVLCSAGALPSLRWAARALVAVVSELSEASGKDTATMEGLIDEAMSEILDAKK